MYMISLNKQYNLVEFDLYVTKNGAKGATYVLELLIDCTIDKFEPINEDFIIKDERDYTFNGFELSEWYEENGMVRVVYVK